MPDRGPHRRRSAACGWWCRRGWWSLRRSRGGQRRCARAIDGPAGCRGARIRAARRADAQCSASSSIRLRPRSERAVLMVSAAGVRGKVKTADRSGTPWPVRPWRSARNTAGGCEMRVRFPVGSAFLAAFVLALVAPASASTTLNTVPGTNVLLSKSGSGPLSSTSSNSNIFPPAAYVDYKRFGGEPTVTVDRFPFPGSNTSAAAKCLGTSPCFKDVTYASSPNGFAYPHYSPFWKSDDLGQSFRVPCHLLAQSQTCVTGGGGGDSHTAVGQVTHRLFFVDLPGPGCVTSNVSDDLGESFVGDNAGCGSSPGVIDDRQWVEADEKAAPCSGGSGQNAYISFINFSNVAAPSLSLARSCHDGNAGTFVTDSVCNTLNAQTPSGSIINPLPTTGAADSD